MNGGPPIVGGMTAMAGDLDAQVHETHTGVVILLGDKAYKVKKPVVTDFLDFSTPESRQHACEREVILNRRLAPQGYLGVGQFVGPAGEPSEPVIEMRRYPDSTRLASLVEAGLNPGAISTPFYAPQGEFELVDPDNYIVMVSHSD